MRVPCEDVIYLLYHQYIEKLDNDGNYAAKEFADHLGVSQEKVVYDEASDEIIVADDVDKSLCNLLEPEEE